MWDTYERQRKVSLSLFLSSPGNWLTQYYNNKHWQAAQHHCTLVVSELWGSSNLLGKVHTKCIACYVFPSLYFFFPNQSIIFLPCCIMDFFKIPRSCPFKNQTLSNRTDLFFKLTRDKLVILLSETALRIKPEHNSLNGGVFCCWEFVCLGFSLR